MCGKAARHFLPVLKGEYISLVKITSVAGYVAVQDLTKVSDIIRSRTYEALFPLIVTAVLYFFLSFGLLPLRDVNCEILVEGVNILDEAADISAVRQKMGMVFQPFNLFSHLMSIENIILGQINLLGISKQEAYDDAMRLLRISHEYQDGINRLCCIL